MTTGLPRPTPRHTDPTGAVGVSAVGRAARRIPSPCRPGQLEFSIGVVGDGCLSQNAAAAATAVCPVKAMARLGVKG